MTMSMFDRITITAEGPNAEITVSAPTVGRAVLELRAAVRKALEIQGVLEAPRPEPVVPAPLFSVPLDLEEPAKPHTAPSPREVMARRQPLTAQRRAVAFTSMTPADRRPNPEPVL
jgi:hypothetical protein